MRFLLDEHYPGWLAADLRSRGIDAVAIVTERTSLIGASDDVVLSEATAEGRSVVTEDVTTFSAAIAAVPDHAGVIFCHYRRFPRTRAGLGSLAAALAALTDSHAATEGTRPSPFVLWLAQSS